MKTIRSVVHRRGFVAAVGLALSLAAGAACAQSYPSQPIKIIVPYGAGGVADITARVLANKLSEQMKQQVIVDNRPGAGQIIASEAVMKADPDGHTLLWMNSGHAVSVSLFKSLPYDPVRDFAPVSTVASFGLALLVAPDSPFKTAAELIAYAKANPKKFNIGTTNIGSTQYGAAELFKAMAGLDVPTVPFKATPMIITAVKGGDLQAMFEILAPVMSHVRSGSLRALAVTYDSRFVGLPDIPTLSEAGVPGYETSAWNAIAVAAKTPAPIVERLNREIHAAIAAPEVRQRLLDLGIDPRASTPAVLREHLVAEIAKWKTVIERAKIEKQ